MFLLRIGSYFIFLKMIYNIFCSQELVVQVTILMTNVCRFASIQELLNKFQTKLLIKFISSIILCIKGMGFNYH